MRQSTKLNLLGWVLLVSSWMPQTATWTAERQSGAFVAAAVMFAAFEVLTAIERMEAKR